MTNMISTLGKKRIDLTSHQKKVLVKTFEDHSYLKRGEKYQLAESLNMNVKRIESWFRNQRFDRRKKEILRKYMSEINILMLSA